MPVRHPKFDFKVALNEKMIVLLNLAKPNIGDEAAAILGALFTTTLRSALLENPRPCTLIADEFQTYGTSLFSGMLSEMRKFGLKMIVAHQFISQIDEALRDAILGNTTQKIIFNVDHKDAEILAKAYNRLTQDFNPSAITDLQAYQAFVNGHKVTLPPFTAPHGTGKLSAVKAHTHRHFARVAPSS